MLKKILAIAGFFLGSLALAQQPLPNISYNAMLNASCTNANTSCPNAVFVTGSQGVNVNGSLGTGTALDIPVGNYVAATITVSGTYNGATINFDFSDPTSGVNYFQEVCARTDINLLETSEIISTANQVRAWQCPVWAANRFRVRLSAISSGSVNVWITLTPAGIDPSLVVAASIANVAGASDPCQDVSAIKQSVAINISSATTTQLVAASGSTTVYACGYHVTAAGTTPTIQFEYGTGGTCGTGTVVLTGTLAPTAGTALTYGPGSTILKSAASTALCMVTTGTPTIQGWLTYVQQ